MSQYDNMNYLGAAGTLELMDEINRQLPDRTGMSLLDFGSGHGGTSRVMAKQLNEKSGEFVFDDILAVDIQPHVHQIAQTLTEMCEGSGDLRCGVVKHVVTDIFEEQHLIGDTERFDVIISRLCVLHIPTELRRTLFNKLSALLKPGGMIVLEDYAQGESPLSESVVHDLQHFVAIPEGRVPDLSEWVCTLAESGTPVTNITLMTKRWASFVAERLTKAIGDDGGSAFDHRYGGSERRMFYEAVCRVFNPPNGAPSEILGLRLFARKV